MKLFLLTLLAFGVITIIMAIGVIFSGRCLRGTCGGEAIVGPDGELLNCDHCPARKEQEAQTGS